VYQGFKIFIQNFGFDQLFFVGAWGSVVVKAMSYYSDGPGIAGEYFRGSDGIMCPGVDSASENVYQGFKIFIKNFCFDQLFFVGAWGSVVVKAMSY